MEPNLEKRKRGRPAGSGNNTFIEDPLIEPFKIYFDETQLTLVKKKPDGNEETYGYYSSLAGVLVKITKVKLVNNKAYTLQSFISEYKQMLENFIQKIDFKI
jgi:hypothetical protein